MLKNKIVSCLSLKVGKELQIDRVNAFLFLDNWITFTFMHLADTFIQSDLRIQAILFLSVCVFPGNRTHHAFAADLSAAHP